MNDPRLNPIDWRQLRAAAEWTETERRQMDVEHEELGEDHAYAIWKERWLGIWRGQ